MYMINKPKCIKKIIKALFSNINGPFCKFLDMDISNLYLMVCYGFQHKCQLKNSHFSFHFMFIDLSHPTYGKLKNK